MSDKDNVENREPLNTMSMLEEGFFKNLDNPLPTATKQNISKKSMDIKESIKKYNTEELLIALFETRDDLVFACQGVELDSPLAQNLTNSINKISSCIRKLGGEVESFDPLNSASGLQTPSMVKNAERVIETTKQYYALGKVDSARVEENGKAIIIIFSGSRGNIQYKATGTITSSKGWIGNEAIDYVYKRGAGKMFVRSYNNDKWVDKSKDYTIAWELEEGDTTPINEINIKENTEKKEEITKGTLNNEVVLNDDFKIEDEAELEKDIGEL